MILQDYGVVLVVIGVFLGAAYLGYLVFKASLPREEQTTYRRVGLGDE